MCKISDSILKLSLKLEPNVFSLYHRVYGVRLNLTWLTFCVRAWLYHADTAHLFEGKENDWGFTHFAQLSDLDEAHGFVQNDSLKLQVKIAVEHPDSYLYNSKRETGFVGLKNQGATCYMNSLLQTLYNINFFRQVWPPAFLKSSHVVRFQAAAQSII